MEPELPLAYAWNVPLALAFTTLTPMEAMATLAGRFTRAMALLAASDWMATMPLPTSMDTPLVKARLEASAVAVAVLEVAPTRVALKLPEVTLPSSAVAPSVRFLFSSLVTFTLAAPMVAPWIKADWSAFRSAVRTLAAILIPEMFTVAVATPASAMAVPMALTSTLPEAVILPPPLMAASARVPTPAEATLAFTLTPVRSPQPPRAGAVFAVARDS